MLWDESGLGVARGGGLHRRTYTHGGVVDGVHAAGPAAAPSGKQQTLVLACLAAVPSPMSDRRALCRTEWSSSSRPTFTMCRQRHATAALLGRGLTHYHRQAGDPGRKAHQSSR